MKKIFGLMISTTILLAACSKTDGIPSVQDPRKPIDAEGNTITGTEFLQRYCEDRDKKLSHEDYETCAKVREARDADTLRGGLPKGW